MARQTYQPSTATVTALRELSVTALAVAAPYDDEVCERLRMFLQGSGFEVVNLANLGLEGMAIGAVPSKQVWELGKRATMWHALRIAGIEARLEGLGRLYRIKVRAADE